MANVSGESRRQVGSAAESAVAAFLERGGYRILKRNYTARCGELDIIAEKDGVLVFVEVKYRRSIMFGAPAEAVTPQKRKRIINTALVYIHENGLYDSAARFDVAEVYGGGEINIIEDAFDLDSISSIAAEGYFEQDYE